MKLSLSLRPSIVTARADIRPVTNYYTHQLFSVLHVIHVLDTTNNVALSSGHRSLVQTIHLHVDKSIWITEVPMATDISDMRQG